VKQGAAADGRGPATIVGFSLAKPCLVRIRRGRRGQHDRRLNIDMALGLAQTRLGEVRRMSSGERRAVRRHTANLDCKVAWLRLIEAVKARDIRRIVTPFLALGPVPGYLAARLAEQVVERSVLRRLKAAS